jgi:uncharacterized membrane protein YhaH (DUF805 family)
MTTTNATSLEQPRYGVGPVEAVTRFFQKYATFTGRASRSEYWWATLAFSLLFAVLGALAGVIGGATQTVGADGSNEPGVAVLVPVGIGFVIGLAAVVPGIAVTVRRLHDANFSGLLYLINAVPYVGGLVVLVLTIMPSNPAGARYDAGATTVVVPAPQAPPAV